MKKRRVTHRIWVKYRYGVLHAHSVRPEGKAPLDAVYGHVRQNMSGEFTKRELEDVPSGGETTWINDVRQQRRDMLNEGLLIRCDEGVFAAE